MDASVEEEEEDDEEEEEEEETDESEEDAETVCWHHCRITILNTLFTFVLTDFYKFVWRMYNEIDAFLCSL